MPHLSLEPELSCSSGPSQCHLTNYSSDINEGPRDVLSGGFVTMQQLRTLSVPAWAALDTSLAALGDLDPCGGQRKTLGIAPSLFC